MLYILFRGIIIFPDQLWNFAVYISFIVNILLALYTLFQSLRFFYLQDHSRFKLIFWGILSASFATAIIIDSPRAALPVVVIFIYYGLNALCIRKNNYGWFIAQAAGWLLCLPGVATIFDSINFLDHLGEEFSTSPIPAFWRVPLVYSAVLFCAITIFCNFKLWAAASGKRLREIWGTGCNIVAVLLILAYTGTCIAAVYQHKQCEKALAALENNFQRKISAEAIRDSKVLVHTPTLSACVT